MTEPLNNRCEGIFPTEKKENSKQNRICQGIGLWKTVKCLEIPKSLRTVDEQCVLAERGRTEMTAERSSLREGLVGHINDCELDLEGCGRLPKDFRLRDRITVSGCPRWIRLLCSGSNGEIRG